MQVRGKKEPIILLLGDAVFFVVSLYVALMLRNFSVPEGTLFFQHLAPFSILFSVSILVFYVAGMYGKQTTLLRSKLLKIILGAQVVNTLLAVSFFYLIDFFGITPKTVLFIFLAIYTLFMILWRRKSFFFVGRRNPEKAIIIGENSETRELLDEVNRNHIYNIQFVRDFDQASVLIADFSDEKLKAILPDLYEQIFSGLTFLDIHKIYEEVFDRVPLSILKYQWFLENISTRRRVAYDIFKRVMDFFLSLILGLISLLLYPFVFLAIKLDDGGKLFITQERVGERGKLVKIIKFRSMSRNDAGDYKSGEENKVTRVGAFLRKSRIDELPQLWNVLVGDISLIGPRPELPALVEVYQREVPYYNVRHLLKPGLSGWAQIHQENHPHHREAVEETKEKLTYDLYYIKNRSIFLDLRIALRTIKTLLSRVGV